MLAETARKTLQKKGTNTARAALRPIYIVISLEYLTALPNIVFIDVPMTATSSVGNKRYNEPIVRMKFGINLFLAGFCSELVRLLRYCFCRYLFRLWFWTSFITFSWLSFCRAPWREKYMAELCLIRQITATSIPKLKRQVAPRSSQNDSSLCLKAEIQVC